MLDVACGNAGTRRSPPPPARSPPRCRRAPAPPRWREPAWSTQLLERHGGADVSVAEHELAFTAASPEAWFGEHEAHHPFWRWARRTLDGTRWAQARAESVAALSAENEDPAAFRTTSGYFVVTARLG